MRVLITGISGFVGQYLANYVSDQDPQAEIFGIERNVKPFQLFPELEQKVKVFSGDITNYNEVEKLVSQIKPEEVYHLAGFASGAGKDRDLMFQVNVEGSLNILKSLQKLARSVKVLLVSTAYVYGQTPTCVNEDAPLAPKSYYDQSKVKMEQEASNYISEKMTIFFSRATNHTGAGQSLGFVVPDLAKQIVQAKNQDQILVGNLQAERDLFNVKDCVKAYYLIMKKGTSGQVYNVGTGGIVSIKEILEKLIKISGKNITYQIDPQRIRPSDIAKNCINNRKIKGLGWAPSVKLADTLQEVLGYWQKNKEK